MRALTVKSLMEYLDGLCKEITIEEYGNQCIICKLIGKETDCGPIQPMHIYSRTFKATRWHPWNILPGGQKHHGYAVHINKALTEDLLKAIHAALLPERFKYIRAHHKDFFDLNINPLLAKKRELIDYQNKVEGHDANNWENCCIF